MASNLTGGGENTKVTPVHKEAISEDVLRRIYVLAQDMCPTPLAYERLQSWVRRSPDFSVHFKATLKGSESTPIGVIVVLPLIGKVWDDLVVGKIKEYNIEPSTMFASESGADVGLHVFYLERFDSAASLCNFFEAVHDMARSIALRKDWNLKGFSALAATASGRLSCKLLGFTPTGYEELALTKRDTNGEMKVNMVYLYPGGRVDGKGGEGKFHSKSEMMVKSEPPRIQTILRKGKL